MLRRLIIFFYSLFHRTQLPLREDWFRKDWGHYTITVDHLPLLQTSGSWYHVTLYHYRQGLVAEYRCIQVRDGERQSWFYYGGENHGAHVTTSEELTALKKLWSNKLVDDLQHDERERRIEMWAKHEGATVSPDNFEEALRPKETP